MANVTPQAYPPGMTANDRVRQRVIDAVTMAAIEGVTEAEITELVRAGLATAGRINDARTPIDWNNLPTIGSFAA